MKINEFLSESIIVEGKMVSGGSKNDWVKRDSKGVYYYLQPFLEGLISNQTYAFEVGGEKFKGKILDGEILSKEMKSALKSGDSDNFKSITFSVQKIDDETGDLEDEVVDNVKLNQIFKDENIKGTLDPNMGNIAEALLGCAIAAKFEKQGQSITEVDLRNMGERIAEAKGKITARAGKDTLTFKLTIPFLDKKTFYSYLGKDSKGLSLEDYKVPSSKIKLLEHHLKSAVVYANTSKRVASAISQANNDPNKNVVDVISDGGEAANQSITKVDLKILIDGQPSAKRLLSVKAGSVKQFGQVGGANFSNLNEFFSSSLGIGLSENVASKFTELPEKARKEWNPQKVKNFNSGFKAAYNEMTKSVKSMAMSDQETLVENVYKGLLHHLTRNEEGVEMVILNPSNKKAFAELDFGENFRQALGQLQLVVEVGTEGEGYSLDIYGIPKTAIAKKFIPKGKDKLVTLYSLMTKSFSVRNRLLMGSLLKNLADIENYIDQAEQQPIQKTQPVVAKQPVQKTVTPATQPVRPGANKPVATNPKPALKVSRPQMGQEPVNPTPV
jgi:dihydroneopterin aldolase